MGEVRPSPPLPLVQGLFVYSRELNDRALLRKMQRMLAEHAEESTAIPAKSPAQSDRRKMSESLESSELPFEYKRPPLTNIITSNIPATPWHVLV